MPKKNTKKTANGTSEPIVTDFGTRAISNQNFSKLVALPKTALANCSPEEIARVNVQLVQDNGEKYIKLTPVSQTEGEKET